jgi:hypothetical protein
VDIVSTDPSRPGIFAFGQFAVGVIAFGQVSLGVVAIGQLARGVFCLGQGAVGVACIGQGAVGLWHATGMVGVAGTRGYGIVAHLLPRLAREKPPQLAPTTPIEDIVSGSAPGGWVSARLIGTNGGPATVAIEGAQAVDTSAVQTTLDLGLPSGNDRAHVYVHAETSIDATDYRQSEKHVRLVAEHAVTYRSSPARYLSYPSLPKGELGDRPSTATFVYRSIAYLVVVALVTLICFLPLASALFNFESPFSLFGE